MRRTEIMEAVETVTAALEQSGVASMIRSMLERGGLSSEKGPEILKVLRAYSLLVKDFSEAALTVQNIMGLDPLDDPTYWTAIFVGGPDEAHRLYEATRFALKYLPKLVMLLENDASRVAAELNASGPAQGTAILTAIILEESERSTPARLCRVLESIGALYEAVALVEGARQSTLAVIGCDSGSDKSFDFLGLASVIAGVKEIILGIWDRILFHRESKLETMLSLVAQSLPIVETIAVMEAGGKIGPEQAELLRRKVVDGVTGFIEGGAVIPEIKKRSVVSVRELVTPARRLLTSGELPADDESTQLQASAPQDTPLDMSGLSSEEVDTLHRLMGKIGGNKP